MIIKSMGRKGSRSSSEVYPVTKNTFKNLVHYMTRGDHNEKAESVIWHGFYGDPRMSEEKVIHEFEKNSKKLKQRKNGNVLYHEIISFSEGNRLNEKELKNAVIDIGQEYLRQRAPTQMAFGAIHLDTDHIHLHLMISANSIGKSDREWMTKTEFNSIQKSVESFVLERYPELAQTKIYDKKKSKEKIKTQSNEQSMKARTKMPSRKENIKMILHGVFEQSKTQDDIHNLSKKYGIHFYERGKSIGVIETLQDGTERRHRLSTLGLDTHYQMTLDRIGKEQNIKESYVENQPPDSYTDSVLEEVRRNRQKTEKWDREQER